jgi:hypothetical protein
VASGIQPERSGSGWDRAALWALVLVVLSVLVFIVIPDRAITYLSKHVAPTARDLVIVTWIAVAFLAMCWVFVRLQGTSRR